MAQQSTRPWETEFKVDKVEGVVETPDLRVLKISLAGGDIIPWHWHAHVTDRFVCLEGVLVVETSSPRACYRLEAGGECLVPAKVPHKVSTDDATPCRFMVIQGVGAYDYHAV
ncbi:MAG: cupin domain-containing protein [Kiloniellales bacterium]|nr:cupin domain-containing protein [Kiloniellales bacterium]